MRNSMKKMVAAAALSTLCMAASAQAVITVPLDINGVSAPVAVLDLSPGSAIAVGSGTLPLPTTSFPLYYQAKLGNYLDTQGNQILGSGLGTSYEVTAVFGFYETIQGGAATNNGLNGTGLTATFNFDPTKSSFVYLFQDPLRDSNNLAGTGFTNGNLILSGHIIPEGFVSSFTASNSISTVTPYANLDSSPNGNQWGGQLSVNGSGGTDITVKVDAFNQQANYFLDAIDLLSFKLFTNTSNNLPFNQVDPSQQFFTGGVFTNPANYFSSVGTLGSVNGRVIDGPNVMFQADANASFEAATVPEPSTIALAGLGLLMVAGFMRRRRSN
jgi:PEP-CTERM motif